MKPDPSLPHYVLITGAGRCGTQFFGLHFAAFFPGACSIHEPDVLHPGDPQRSWKLRHMGLYRLFLGKLLRQTGMRNLSLAAVTRDMTSAEAACWLARDRVRVLRHLDTPLFAEAHYGWWGALHFLPTAFASYRVVSIVREPLAWVESWLAHGGWFDRRDWIRRLGFGRLSASQVGEVSAEEWTRWDRHEKLAWTWQFIYAQAVQAAEQDPKIRLASFERHFLHPSDEAMQETLEFLAGPHSASLQLDQVRRLRSQKENRTMGNVTLGARERRRVLEICESTVNRLETHLPS